MILNKNIKMSILDSFSLEYRMSKFRSNIRASEEEKMSKNKSMEMVKHNIHNSVQQSPKKIERKKTYSIHPKIINQLLELGFKFDSIITLAKQKKFTTTEEALNYLEKDPESNLYNHYFISDRNSKNNLCKICQQPLEVHIKEDEEFQTLKETKGKFLTCSNEISNNFKENQSKNNKTSVKKKSLFSISKAKLPINLNLNIVSGNSINNINQITKNHKNKNQNFIDDSGNIPMLLARKNNNYCNLNNLNNNSEMLLLNNKINKLPKKRKSVEQIPTINYNISININENKRRNSKQSNIAQPITIKNYSNTKESNNNNFQVFGNDENDSDENENNLHNQNQANTVYTKKNNDENNINNSIININDYYFNQSNKNLEKINNIKLPNYCKIEIPKETLDSFQDPDICPICYANKINKNNIAQKNCCHKFCDECIKTYLTKKIMDGEVLKLKCLMGGCKQTYNQEQIQANVSPNVFNKYIKFYNIQKKLKNPNHTYINCAAVDCEELVDCTNINEGNVTCSLGHVFCRKCFKIGGHQPNEPPCSIDDLNVDFFSELNRQNSYNVRVKYKQCPKCKVLIEKIDGCNQMKCLNCGFNFCWLCLREYTSNHYSIYNSRGCPGMRFETDRMYRIRNNPCYNCLWHMLICLLEVLMFIAIYLFYLFCGCAYEFVKCYRNRGKKDSPRDMNMYDIMNIDENGSYSSYSRRITLGLMNRKETDNKYVIILLISLGVLCQPLYLMFYLLYALIECYRRFNCMFYLPD